VKALYQSFYFPWNSANFIFLMEEDLAQSDSFSRYSFLSALSWIANRALSPT